MFNTQVLISIQAKKQRTVLCRFLLVTIAIAAITLAMAQVAYADDRYWDGGADADWNDANNWSDTDGGSTPASSVPGTGDHAHFTANGDGNPCTFDIDVTLGNLTVLIGYTSKIDLGIKNLTMNNGGNITLDGAGEFDLGTGTISLTNGDFDYEHQTITKGMSTVVMSGTGNWIGRGGGAASLYAVTISVGAAITLTTGEPEVSNVLTCNGGLSIASERTLTIVSSTTGDVQFGASGSISGDGTLALWRIGGGRGISVKPGGATVTVASLVVQRPEADGVIAAGEYDVGLFKVQNTEAAAKTLTLSSGSYIFTGNVEFENTDAGGSLTVNNTNDPSITIQGDVIWDEQAGTITYTKGASDMTLSGTGDQNIDFNGQASEDLVINKTTSGKVTLVDTITELQAIDMVGDTAQALVVTGSTITSSADAKNFVGVGDNSADVNFSDAGNDINLGSASWNITNGDFVYKDATAFTGGASMLVMSGTGTITGVSTSNLYNLTVSLGAVITVDQIIQSIGTVIVNGTLSVDSDKIIYNAGLSTVQIGSSGRITGAGRYLLQSCGTGEGITSFAPGGVIDVAQLNIYHPSAAALFAPGLYESALVRIQNSGASAYTLTLSSGDYTFTGDVEFENTNAGGSLTINNTNDPSITIQGDVIWDEQAGTITYTKGASDMVLSGTGDQNIDFNGQASEDLVINKTTSGNVTLVDTITELQAIDMVGDTAQALVVTGSTITSSADAKNFVGALANSADVNFSDAGNDINLGAATWTITNGDFNYLNCGTFVDGTSHVILAGTGDWTSKNGESIYDLTISSGAVIASKGNPYLTNDATIDGVLLVDASRTVRVTVNGDLSINSGGRIGGNGTLWLHDSNAGGHGLLVLDGTLDVALTRIHDNDSAMTLAAGNYGSADTLIFAQFGALNITVTMAAGAYTFQNLELYTQGTLNLTLANYTNGPASITINGDLTIDEDAGGAIVIDDSGQAVAWNITGDVVDQRTGDTFTWTKGTGAITLSGGGGADDSIDFMGQSVEDIIINDIDGGTKQLNTALITDSVTITSGTLDANGQDITVAGDWSNSDTFTHNNNTVIFDTAGTTTTISGNNTFYNLTSITPLKRIDFTAGTTQTITNILNLNGQVGGTRIDLNSDTPGTQWNIDTTGATVTADFVDVQDSNSTVMIGATNSIDSGNNVNWFIVYDPPTYPIGGGSMPSPRSPSPNLENPEGGLKVLINPIELLSGKLISSKYTEDRRITLRFFANEDTRRMSISSSSDINEESTRIPFQSIYSYDLCNQERDCPEGEYTIYVRFYTKYGRSSDIVSQTLTLRKEKTIIEEIKELPKEIIELFKPKEEEPKEYPPLKEIVVREEPPLVLQGLWNLLFSQTIKEFVLSPLPQEIKSLTEKFPQLEETFEKIGITKIGDIQKLRTIELTLPGLTEVLGLSTQEVIEPGKLTLPKGIPVGELPVRIKERIPAEIIFAKTGGEVVDFDIKLTIDEQGKPQQRINTISGQPLQLVVKPDNPVKSIKGYLVFKKKSQELGVMNNEIPLNSLLASAMFASPKFAQIQEKPVRVEERLVLLEFEYTDPDNDGIYTAEILAPVVAGEYEVITVIDYQDPELGRKVIRLITVVDPEGYVYEKTSRNQETRISGAIVSLYWLNPETKQYILWPAQEYQQENPQITDNTGKYSFLVPEGSYYLKVETPSYLTFEGKPFQVIEGSGVHTNIELKTKYWWLKVFDWKTIVLVLVVLLLFYNFYRDKIRNRIKNQKS